VRNRLEESNAQKDEFLAVMSHELKNPLNVIHMNAQLLMRLPQARNAPVVTKAAQAIASAAASQAQMIDDLLDLSRVNTGKVVLGRVQVVLNEVIERIASAVENDVAAKGLSLHVSLGERLAVSADLVRIEQIVWNLVTNAIKFTPERGSIRISLSRDDTWARLEVSDTGIGLEANHLDQGSRSFGRSISVRAARRPALASGWRSSSSWWNHLTAVAVSGMRARPIGNARWKPASMRIWGSP